MRQPGKRGNSSTMSNIVVEIKKQMDATGLSAAMIAQELGVSQQRVSQMLSGRENLTVLSLERMAKALNRTLRVKFVS